MNLKERARAIKIYLPALFLAMKRADTPLPAKLLAGLAVGYALSPIDLVPDFIPVLGLLDDLILLPLLVALAIRLIPAPILGECKREAEGLWLPLPDEDAGKGTAFMRNQRFVAVHRGGILTPEDHRLMMSWALACLAAADDLYGKPLPGPLLEAREAANAWFSGTVPTGAPMKAAREAHRFARTLDNPVERSIARAFGHAAATAHASDHALGVLLYLAKARRAAGLPAAEAREQELALLGILPAELAETVSETLFLKEHPSALRRR